MRNGFAALVLLLFAGCGPTRPGPAIPEPGKDDAYRFDGPYRMENLSIFLIRHPDVARSGETYLTLDEAMKAGSVKITEKEEGAEVNELHVENTGDRPVYIQAGDTVKGGQQDRTIAVDFVLPPRSGKRPVKAFCVEPGRWSVRGEGGASAQGGSLSGATFTLDEARVAAFSLAPSTLATADQKLAVRLEKDQGAVWNAGRMANQRLAARAGKSADEAQDSYVLALEDPKVRAQVGDFVAALKGRGEGRDDVVGMAYAVDGRVRGAEIYATPALFRKLWTRLLRSCAVEALVGRKDSGGTPAVTGADVRRVLREASAAKERVEQRPEGPEIRIREADHAVLFDTVKDGRVLHRQLVTK